jgi:hypothetical protein
MVASCASRATRVRRCPSFSSRYACVLPATLSKCLFSAEYPVIGGVQEGISLSFAVSSALWLRVAFLPERACSLKYSALPANSALPTDGTDPEGLPALPPPTSSIQPFSAPPLLDVVLRRLQKIDLEQLV